MTFLADLALRPLVVAARTNRTPGSQSCTPVGEYETERRAQVAV